MIVEHRLTIVAKCPVDDCPDVYGCTVTTSRVIMVEDIWKCVKELIRSPRTQEDITINMARQLECRVETVGVHSAIRTKVVEGQL